MLTEKRRSLIENYVNEHELCRVTDLCKLTKTSASTIRRDLIQMEATGRIKRVHGGARSVKNFSRNVAQHIRFNLNHPVKLYLAHYAVKHLVHNGDHLFLDAGTTIYEMVPFIAALHLQVTIVTNGLETALAAVGHELPTVLIGGWLKNDTHAAVGRNAIHELQALNLTSSFLGTNGVDAQGNLSTPDPEEAAVKQVGIRRARHAYVLTDASKIGRRDFAIFSNIKQVPVLTNQLNSTQKAVLPAKGKLKEVSK